MSIILMKLVMNGGWKAELLNGGMGREKEEWVEVKSNTESLGRIRD